MLSVLAEHEVARLVEHERGGHRAQELDDRGVRVLQRDRPPARASALPARFHELLGLDRVRAEMTDLVAGAEVLLELPGDHTELVARPRQRAVRERELDDGEEDDEPDEPEHHRDDARRHDDDRAERDDGDHELAREPERLLLDERQDPVEVGDHARGDVARELAVVVVHAQLAQAVEDATAEHDDQALVEPLREDPGVLRREADADGDEHDQQGPEVCGRGVGSVALLDDVRDLAEDDVGGDSPDRVEQDQEQGRRTSSRGTASRSSRTAVFDSSSVTVGGDAHLLFGDPSSRRAWRSSGRARRGRRSLRRRPAACRRRSRSSCRSARLRPPPRSGRHRRWPRRSRSSRRSSSTGSSSSLWASSATEFDRLRGLERDRTGWRARRGRSRRVM